MFKLRHPPSLTNTTGKNDGHGWYKRRRRGSCFAFHTYLLLNSYQKLVFESSEAVNVVSTFDDLGLKEDLLRGIYAYSKIYYSYNSTPHPNLAVRL